MLPFSNLAPLWLERDWVGVVVVVGALIGRVSQCFQKRRVLAASRNMMQKMPAANESQQCLSHWTTTLKGIMQLRHHKHFKIVSQQIISVYFFHIIADIFFFKQFAIEGTALSVNEVSLVSRLKLFFYSVNKWSSGQNLKG